MNCALLVDTVNKRSLHIWSWGKAVKVGLGNFIWEFKAKTPFYYLGPTVIPTHPNLGSI